jgi:hypothetical protein
MILNSTYLNYKNITDNEDKVLKVPCINQFGTREPFACFSHTYPIHSPIDPLNTVIIMAFRSPAEEYIMTPCINPKITPCSVLPTANPNFLIRHFPRKPLKIFVVAYSKLSFFFRTLTVPR